MKEIIMTINDEKVYVRYNDLEGDKIPIIFIPGWGCASSFDFVELAAQKEISEHRRILIDLLGAGYSDSPENFSYRPEDHAYYLKNLIEKINLDEFIIYAHSMGGRVAISLADLLPNKVKGVILSEGSMQQEYFPYMDKGEETFEKEYFYKMLRSLGRKDDQKFLATVRLASPKALYREAREMMEEKSYKWEETFFNASYEKVFIVGDETDDEGFNLSRIKAAKIKTISIEKAGHSMNWDMPKETALAIKEALEYIEK